MKLSTNTKQEVDTIITTLNMLDIKFYAKIDNINFFNTHHYDIYFNIANNNYKIRLVFHNEQFDFLSFIQIYKSKDSLPNNIKTLFQNNYLKEGIEESILYITRIIKHNEIAN